MALSTAASLGISVTPASPSGRISWATKLQINIAIPPSRPASSTLFVIVPPGRPEQRVALLHDLFDLRHEVGHLRLHTLHNFAIERRLFLYHRLARRRLVERQDAVDLIFVEGIGVSLHVHRFHVCPTGFLRDEREQPFLPVLHFCHLGLRDVALLSHLFFDLADHHLRHLVHHLLLLLFDVHHAEQLIDLGGFGGLVGAGQRGQ